MDGQLCVALQRAARAITASYRPLLRDLGLTYTQYALLLVLWERDSVPMRVLADALQLDSGTLSPLVKRLEAKGLVARHRRLDDERTIQVTITSDGRALRPAAAAVQARVQAATGLTAARVAAMRDELNALAARLQADSDAPPAAAAS